MKTLALGTWLALAACGPTSPPAPPASAPDPNAPFASEADYRRQLAEAVAALEAAVETGATDPAACRVIMHSEQACGGLTDWVVLSAETSDTTRVRALADRVTGLTRKANAQFEWVSTCVAYEPPPLALRDGHCVEAR